MRNTEDKYFNLDQLFLEKGFPVVSTHTRPPKAWWAQYVS